MRAPICWPAPAVLAAVTVVAGCLLFLEAGCRPETHAPLPAPGPPPTPALPPKLAVFDAAGAPLQEGSIVEAVVTELPGDHMTIKGELKMTNTGGPVVGVVRSGWRLPRGFVPWAKDKPGDLPVGDEFAYEVGYSDFDGLAVAPSEEKRTLAFHCELEPGMWLPAEMPVEYYLKREGDAEDLFHVRFRLRPQWPLSFQPESSPGGATLVRRTLTEGRGSAMTDVDWIHTYKFVSRGNSSLGMLTGYRYLKARGPYSEPDAAHPIVVTELAPPPNQWPAPNYPPGFSVAQPWNLGKYLLRAHETSDDWNLSFHLGRGGYVPPGRHEVAVEMHSRGVIVYRSSYSIDVPGKLPFPNLELLGKDDQPLVPGAQLAGRVDSRPGNESTGAAAIITVSVPVRVLADGLRPEDQLPETPDDLRWMFLLSDALLPGRQAGGLTDVFELGEMRYFALLESGNLAALADGKPHELELRLPLDPKLAQARPDQPGLWIPPGVHHARLLAFPVKKGPIVGRRLAMGLKPERSLFLFERDFAISISQAAPIPTTP